MFNTCTFLHGVCLHSFSITPVKLRSSFLFFPFIFSLALCPSFSNIFMFQSCTFLHSMSLHPLPSLLFHYGLPLLLFLLFLVYLFVPLPVIFFFFMFHTCTFLHGMSLHNLPSLLFYHGLLFFFLLCLVLFFIPLSVLFFMSHLFLSSRYISPLCFYHPCFTTV